MALVIDVKMGKVSNTKGSNGGLNLGNAIKTITGEGESIVNLYQKVLESMSGEAYIGSEMLNIVRSIAPNTKPPEYVELDVLGKDSVKLGKVALQLLTLDFSDKKSILKRSIDDYSQLTNAGELMNHVFANLALYGKFPVLAQAVNAAIGDLGKAKMALLALDNAIDESSAIAKDAMVFFVEFGQFTYTDSKGNVIKRLNTFVKKGADGKEIVEKEIVDKSLWIGGKAIVWANENRESLQKVILSRFVGTDKIEAFVQSELESIVTPAELEPIVTPAELEPIVTPEAIRPDVQIELVMGDANYQFDFSKDLVDLNELVESSFKERMLENGKLKDTKMRELGKANLKSAKQAVLNWLGEVIANA